MTDIFAAVKPLLYVSVVLGLGPFSIDEESKTVSSSNVYVLYSLVVFVLLASTSTYSAYAKFNNLSAKHNYIGNYTYLVLYVCGIIVALCCLLLVVVQRKKIIAMIENFHNVDCQMAKLDVHVPYKRITWISTLILTVFALVLSCLFLHDVFITEAQNDPIFWVTYFAPIVHALVMQCQFIYGGLLLRWNFAHLNERLTNLGVADDLVLSGRKKLMEGGGYFEPSIIRRSSDHVASAWESDFSKFRIRKIMPRGDLTTPPLSSLSKIKLIRKIHSNLGEIKELLNSSYSLQLLTTVAQAFIIITTNLYIIFTSGATVTAYPSSSPGSNVFILSYSIIWALYRSLELVCITVTCSKICKTANHTAVIVHKLLSRDWDSNVRNQLKLFSIQLLHRKISFSACGFFTLDLTLLHGIIGAATTYLVILIQFHNTYEESS